MKRMPINRQYLKEEFLWAKKVDLIMSNNEGIYYGVYHSVNNSFGATKDYPVESLSSKEAITLSNKLGIGFCED